MSWGSVPLRCWHGQHRCGSCYSLLGSQQQGEAKRVITSYFARVEADPELIGELCARYDVAPPPKYVSDKQISESLRSGSEGQAD
jgi:hypothetical protein